MSNWTPVLAALVAVLLLGVLLWLHLWFWRRQLTVAMEYAEEILLSTGDGARIQLRRLPRLAERDAQSPPVLLVHGLGANHRNIDALPERSLARHLSAAGHDVWLLTLRSGLGDLGRLERRGVRFEHMAEQDLPLGIETVLERTGHTQVDFVGFSMGGMLLYAALGESVPPEAVRRAVIIGSPILIGTPGGIWLPRVLSRTPEWLTPTLRLRTLAALSAPWAELFRTPFHRVVVNPDNVERGDSRLSMVNLIADIPGSLNLDFARWALAEGGALVVDGQSVIDRLHRATTPVLFFAGAVDQIAPPASVRAAFEHWGSDVEQIAKRFVLLGQEAGARADYGHGDLAIGRHAREDIFEPIARFLAEPDVVPEGES